MASARVPSLSRRYPTSSTDRTDSLGGHDATELPRSSARRRRLHPHRAHGGGPDLYGQRLIMIGRVAAARRRRFEDRPDDGFTIVEVVVAMAVFAILATAFAATLSASLRSLALSRARTTAEQLASSQLEEMRRVAYTDLGTVGGNPPGVVTPTKTVTTGTQSLTMATTISYVNDPAPSAKETGADYK